MATLTFTPLLAEQGSLSDLFQSLTIDQENIADTVISLDDGLYRLSFVGENITHDVSSWAPTGGDVHHLTFWNNFQTMLQVDGLDYPIVRLYDILTDGGVSGLMDFVLKGADRLIGSDVGDDLDAGRGNDRILAGKGGDHIVGGKGDDRLTGGAGSDEFQFDGRSGRDVITDFDAIGGGSRQDHLLIASGQDFEVHRSGQNLVLDFGHGHMLTLVDVARSDFSGADVDYYSH